MNIKKNSLSFLSLFLLFNIVFAVAYSDAFGDTFEKDRKFAEQLYHDALYHQAGIQYQSLIQNYPESPFLQEFYFKLAESFFYSHDYLTAERYFRQYLFLFPEMEKSALALYQIAQCHYLSDQVNQAVSSYQSIYQFYPESKWAHDGLYQAANLAYTLQLHKKSNSILFELLSQNIQKELALKANLLLIENYYKMQEYQSIINQLNAFVLKNPMVQYKALALHYYGLVFYKLGENQKAKSSFKESNQMASDSLKQLNYYYMALISELLNDKNQATEYYLKSLISRNNKTATYQSLYALANLYFIQKDYENAKTYLIQMSELNDNASSVLLGQCYYYLGDYLNAETVLNDLIQHENVNQKFRKTGLLWIGEIYQKQSKFHQAVKSYQLYLSNYPDDSLVPFVLNQIVQLYLEDMHRPSFAIPFLYDLWTHYPDHALVPQSKFQYAKYLLDTQQYPEAAQLFNELISNYPESHYAHASQILLLLNSAFDSDSEFDSIQNLQNLLQLKYLLAAEYFKNRQYDKTIPLLLDLDNAESALSFNQNIQYLIAVTFHQLYYQTEQSQYKEKAKSSYQRVLKKNLTNPHLLGAINLYTALFDSSGHVTLDIYQSMINDSLDTKVKRHIHNKIAAYYLNLDSINTALNYLVSAEEDPEATLLKGQALIRQNQFSLADSLLNYFLRNSPRSPYSSEACYLLSRNALQFQKDSLALQYLEMLHNEYPYTFWAEKSLLTLAKLYMEQNQYHNTLALSNTIITKDSLNKIATQLKLTERKEYPVKSALYLSALACFNSGDLQKSRKIAFQYLHTYPNTENQVHILVLLSEINQQLSRFEEAAYFLKRAVSVMPSDSLYEKLANYQFKSNQYTESVASYDKAFGLSDDINFQAWVASRVILAYLKQGEISKAIARETVFLNEYKRVPEYKEFLAEISIAKGNYYLSKKNFEDALEAFEKVTKSYKRTSQVPEAQLGIGKTYLITNHIEKALKLLTDMPDEFPNHPVLVRVYLNLGDHYFRSKQYRNAMIAFQKATYDYVDPLTNPVAMRYLIRVYESLGMYDSALSTTRQYIERYPDSEDQLQKRVQIGVFLMKLNEYRRAIDQFEKVKIDADYETEAEIQYWIGKSYAGMGQMEKAILEFLKVKYVLRPTKLPWASTALYEAAQAYLKINQKENAKKIFKKIIQSEGATSDLGRIVQQKINEIESEE